MPLEVQEQFIPRIHKVWSTPKLNHSMFLLELENTLIHHANDFADFIPWSSQDSEEPMNSYFPNVSAEGKRKCPKEHPQANKERTEYGLDEPHLPHHVPVPVDNAPPPTVHTSHPFKSILQRCQQQIVERNVAQSKDWNSAVVHPQLDLIKQHVVSTEAILSLVADESHQWSAHAQKGFV